MGIDKYPRQYQDISSECWLLLPACWWPPCAGPPQGGGGTGVTEALNHPRCHRGRRQHGQTPRTVLTNPPRRWMPSAALSHPRISFSVKQNLACKQPNFLEEYGCLTLERWILILLFRNNGSFCPACMAPSHHFWIIQKTLGSTFKLSQLNNLTFLTFYTCSAGQRKKTWTIFHTFSKEFTLQKNIMLNIH